MSADRLRWLAAAGGLLAAPVLLAAGVLESPLSALAVPVAFAVAAAVFLRPFYGVFLIVLLTQLDSLARLLYGDLPLSAFKLLSVLTVGGLVFEFHREARRDRLGFDSPALRLALLFGLVILLSSLFSDDLGVSLDSARRILSLLVLLYLVVRLTRDARELRAIVLAVLVSTLLSAGIALFDFLTGAQLIGIERVGEWEGVARMAGASDVGPTISAHMMLAGTTLALMISLRSAWMRPLCLITAAVGTAGMVTSFARSAGLAMVVALVWAAFKLRRHRRFPGLVVVAVVLAALVIPVIPAGYWDRFEALTKPGADSTVDRRFGYHVIALDLLARNPLIGVGPGNYAAHYLDDDYRWVPGRRLLYGRRMHNMYLSVAAETGLLGFACFGGMLLLTLIALQRARSECPDPQLRVLAEAIQYAYVTFLVASVFTPNEFNKYTWILTGLGVAVGRIALAASPRSSPAAGREAPPRSGLVVSSRPQLDLS